MANAQEDEGYSLVVWRDVILFEVACVAKGRTRFQMGRGALDGVLGGQDKLQVKMDKEMGARARAGAHVQLPRGREHI